MDLEEDQSEKIILIALLIALIALKLITSLKLSKKQFSAICN